jgi:hypothetical protein
MLTNTAKPLNIVAFFLLLLVSLSKLWKEEGISEEEEEEEAMMFPFTHLETQFEDPLPPILHSYPCSQAGSILLTMISCTSMR